MMKKILMASILLIPLLIIPLVCFAVEPPSCYNGWTIIGPPVVGTWVVDYIGGEAPFYNLSFKFKGCCADCFDHRATCDGKVKLQWTDNSLGIMPEDIMQTYVQDYSINGMGPKKCNPKTADGIEVKDLVITTILKFDKSDIDGDGVKELVADVVMYYWVCNP